MNDVVSGTPVIEMRNVLVSALTDPSLVLLEDVNWSVQAGEFWVVAGLQHSGKSDLLMHAAGLTVPVSGECRVFGLDTREFDETRIAERLRMGFTFVGGKLFNQLTIAENVALPLRYHRGLPEAETAKIVEELLELVGMAQYASVTPANITPARRQRAALARALALKPELLMLDNPNAGLTARHRPWLTEFLNQLWRGHPFFGGRPTTIVVTTDDLQMWQRPGHKFAAVHEGHFGVLGEWGATEFDRHQVVKDLLAGVVQTQETTMLKKEDAGVH